VLGPDAVVWGGVQHRPVATQKKFLVMISIMMPKLIMITISELV
jgi:hypothetical protein